MTDDKWYSVSIVVIRGILDKRERVRHGTR